MTTNNREIIRKAAKALIDEDNERWTLGELVDYLNEAEREMYLLRPDLYASRVTETFSQDSNYISFSPYDEKILDVEYATTLTDSTTYPIRLVDMATLEAVMPDWRNATATNAVKHYMFDPRDRSIVYLYPPAKADTRIRLLKAVLPEPIAQPTAGQTYLDVTGIVTVPEEFEGALVSYVLHKAYLKDSEEAGSQARAQSYYQHFATILGVSTKTTVETGPGAMAP